jgi:hypothetical protein
MKDELAALIRMEEADTRGGIHREEMNGLQSLNIPAMKLTGLATSGAWRLAGSNSEVCLRFSSLTEEYSG